LFTAFIPCRIDAGSSTLVASVVNKIENPLYLPDMWNFMIRAIRKWVLLMLTALLLFSQPEKMWAQGETAKTKQLWFLWQHNHYFTHRFRYIGDLGYKQELPYHNWIRMNYKPTIQWSAGNIVDLSGGMGFYYTVQKIIPNSLELRPWQGVQVHWPSLGRFNFDHYARFEQRFNHSIGSTEPWSFALRSRYRLNVTFPLNHPGIIDKTLFMRVNTELFWDMGKGITERFVTKNRYTMGIGYRFNLKWRLELYYLAEQSQAFSREGFDVNSHIILVSLRTYIFKDS
jgi:hypothetical protein